MEIAIEMKNLVRDIASSHKDRMKRIGEIRQEVKGARVEALDMMHSFGDSLKETSRQVRGDLARDKTSRTSEVKGILKESQNILKSFRASQKEAGTRLRKDLSRGTEERLTEVKKTLGNARELIKGFGASRQNVGYELRKNLVRSRAKVKSEVGELRGDAQSLVKDFRTARRETGGKLRKDLAQSRATIASGVKQMQSDLREARENVRADLREARAAWQGLSGIVHSGNGGTEIPQKRETPATREASPDLETKMLAAINGYPAGGITLADLSNILGVAPVVLGRVSKGLVNKGKVRKQEKLYFPAAGESDTEQGFHFKPPIR